MRLTAPTPAQVMPRATTAQPFVVFDSRIDDLPHLMAGLDHGDTLVLHPDQDGIDQITQALQRRGLVSSLHIVSHGASGYLQLGNTHLSLNNLARYAHQLEAWSTAIQGQDLLLYGCHVAQGAMGQLFIQQLHQLTGAQVAASTAGVGYVDGTPRWRLEAQVGNVQTPIVFSQAVQSTYRGHLETVNFSVSTNTLIESEGTPFSFNFTVDGPIPPGGSVIRLEANVPQAINQWDLFQLTTTGLSGGFGVGIIDVSPALDFSAFNVTIVEPTASISLPIFNDFIDDSPATFTWTATPVSSGTTVNTVGSTTVNIYDDPSELPPSVPTVSIVGSPTLIVEDEGTLATVEVSLDRPAPAGGLNVSIGTTAFRGLADFNVFSPQTSLQNFQIVLGFPNNAGIVLRVVAGATTARVTFPVFNDNDDPVNGTINDDIGFDVQTWTLDPQVALAAGVPAAAIGNYGIASNAGSFTWTILDTRGQLNAPVASDDAASTSEDQAVSGNVLSNDNDADGDSLTVSAVNGEAASVGQPIQLASGALLTLNADGSYSYDPNGAFDSLNDGETATDSFTYTVTDGNQISLGVFNEDTATVNITVNGVSPVIPEVSLTTSTTFAGPENALVEDQDTVLTVQFNLSAPAPAGGLRIFVDSNVEQMVNRLDLPSFVFNPQVQNINPATFSTDFNNSGFALTINPGATSASFSIPVFDNPEPDTTLPATFDGKVEAIFSLKTKDLVPPEDAADITNISDYTVSSTAGSSTVIFVDTESQLAPPPVNTPPVADDDVYAIAFNTPLTVNAANGVLDGDTDADGDPLTAAIATQPGSGSVTLNADGSFSYIPNNGFSGTDSFTYTVSDGRGGTDTATVSINVAGPSTGGTPVVSFSTTPEIISEAEGTALVMNFSVDGDIPEGGITVNLEGDAARIMQQFTVAQVRFNPDGTPFYRFDNGFANPANGFIVGGTLDRFSLEDGDPAENAANEAAAGMGFLSNFSFTITEANASITIPVLDDIVEEPDQTFTYTLAPGAGYTVDPNQNSGTFTLTDGVPGGVGPTVGVTATPDLLYENEQTVVTVTFTTTGDIPAEGLVVFLEGPSRAIAEFDVNATNPRLPESQTVVEGVEVTGGNIVGTNETAGGVFFRIFEPTATIRVPVFQDDVAEGPETLTFNLRDGELYEVDANASSVTVTIDDVAPVAPVVSFSTTPGIISEAEGTSLVMNFSVDGDIPEGGITVNLEGDVARIMQQFTVAQTRVNADGTLRYFFASNFVNPANGFVVGGTLGQFSLEDGDPSPLVSNEAAAGTGFLSNFSFTITEPTASITIPVLDDIVAEPDQTFTYTLADGSGYSVNPDANSGTFTVTDGVPTGVGPTVGVTASPTDLVESEQTVIEVTFTVDGDIPQDGLVVQLQGPPRAIAEFDVTASNPRRPQEGVPQGVTVTGGTIIGTDEVAGALIFRITEPTATVKVAVFQDTVVEGTEVLPFTLLDGELYNVDPNASSVTVTIEDTRAPSGTVIFNQVLGGQDFKVSLVEDDPVYTIGNREVATVNDFLKEAVATLGGSTFRNGAIDEEALEHFGRNRNPGIRQVAATNMVVIGGQAVAGQFRARFSDAATATLFEAFADDLLGKDPAPRKVFQFRGSTNGGANRIQIFANDEIIGLNPGTMNGLGTPDSLLFKWSGADTRGTAATTSQDTFFEEMGQLFGGIQIEDGALTGFGIQEAELVGPDLNQVSFGSSGVAGQEIWEFGNQSEAQNFLTFFNNAVDAIATV